MPSFADGTRLVSTVFLSPFVRCSDFALSSSISHRTAFVIKFNDFLQCLLSPGTCLCGVMVIHDILYCSRFGRHRNLPGRLMLLIFDWLGWRWLFDLSMCGEGKLLEPTCMSVGGLASRLPGLSCSRCWLVRRRCLWDIWYQLRTTWDSKAAREKSLQYRDRLKWLAV